MDKEKFLFTVIDFIERGILPKVKSDILRWAGGGMLPMLFIVLNQKLDELSGMLTALGIMGANGDISLQQVQAFLDGAFRQQPELRLEAQTLLPKNVPEYIRDMFDGVAVRLSSQDANDFMVMLRERT